MIVMSFLFLVGSWSLHHYICFSAIPSTVLQLYVDKMYVKIFL